MFLSHWLRSLRANVWMSSSLRLRPRGGIACGRNWPAEVQILEARRLLSACGDDFAVVTAVEEIAPGAVIVHTTVDADAIDADSFSLNSFSSDGDAPPEIPSELNGNGLQFNLIPAGGMSQQAIDGFTAAANLWSSILTDDIIVNININFTDLAAGVLGSAGSTTQGLSLSNVRTALQGDAKSLFDQTAVANLPTDATLSLYTSNQNTLAPMIDNNGTTNNITLDVNTATAKAIGLRAANSITSDANISFNTDFTWDFDRSNGISGFDFIGIAAHEIGHALGFRSGADLVDHFSSGGAGGALDLNNFRTVTTLDLFRHSAGNESNGTDVDIRADMDVKYFSIDGGATSITTFSTGRWHGDGRQASHWKDSLGIGLMDPTAGSGEFNDITDFDVMAFDVIGWDVAMDYGDAPDTGIGTGTGNYRTNLDDDGPRHYLFDASGLITDPAGAPKVFLGSGVSNELDGQPNVNATGDTDDGIAAFPALTIGTTQNISVTSTAGGATLNYFFDFNHDGDFTDAGEAFAATLTTGTQSVPVTIPFNAIPGETLARFRISTAGGLSSTGPAADGEVEDYLVNLEAPPMFISEIMHNSGGSDFGNEYLEFRGAPNTLIPTGTYLVGIEGKGLTAPVPHGDIQTIFNLGGLTFGSNGYLVVKGSQNYAVDPNATVLTSPSSGFLNLPGGRYSADGGSAEIEDDSVTFMLIQTSTAPTLANDIDSNDDGIADGSVYAGWTVLDSVGVLDGGIGDVSYASLTFRNGTNGVAPNGTLVQVDFVSGYAARVGNSIDHFANDWVASETSHNPPLLRFGTDSYPDHIPSEEMLSDDLGALNTFSVNIAPVLLMPGSAVNYSGGMPAVVIDGSALVNDPDSANFDTGTLTVALTANGDAGDRLEIRNEGVGAGQIGISGSTVTFGGTAIGTFAGGTDGATPLVVTLNASATDAAVRALVRNVTFRTVSGNTPAAVRTVEFTLTDGDGGSTGPIAETINVSPTVYIVDDGDAAFSTVGSWVLYGSSGRGSDVRYIHNSAPPATATWEFSGLNSGVYRVSATWPGATASVRSTNAPYTIRETLAGPILHTALVNQIPDPNVYIDAGSAWDDLGTVKVLGNSLFVQLSNVGADNYVIADAIRLERMGDAPIETEIVAMTLSGQGINNGGSFDFGDTTTGNAVSRTFVIHNVGSTNLELQPASLPFGYSVVGSNFTAGQMVSPGNSVQLTVQLDAASPDSYSGPLFFGTNDADENPFFVMISGDVFAPAEAPVLMIIDNGAAGYSESGAWVDWNSNGRDGDLQYLTHAADPAGIATWAFTGLSAGQYRVSTTWVGARQPGQRRAVLRPRNVAADPCWR